MFPSACLLMSLLFGLDYIDHMTRYSIRYLVSHKLSITSQSQNKRRTRQTFLFSKCINYQLVFIFNDHRSSGLRSIGTGISFVHINWHGFLYFFHDQFHTYSLTSLMSGFTSELSPETRQLIC